ncbi:MAG: hypothetical protein ABIG03_00845 [Candidatus Eisenbacteria bacterium]
MRHLRRATLALPALLVALGLAIPAVVGGGGSRPPASPEAAAPRYAGKTAAEWHALALASLEGEEFALAIRYLKTAEKVEPGRQYASELSGVRRAMRTARDTEAARDRLLGGEPDVLEFDDGGAVLAAHRTTVALPGESLWSLAVDLAAARRGVTPTDVPRDGPEVYAAWDALTDMNGLRELEVGESVLVPLSVAEMSSMSEANARDLERVHLVHAALDSGRIDLARSLRDGIDGDFVLSSGAVEVLERRIRQSRVGELLASAGDIAESVSEIPRPTRHAELVSSLRRARAMLEEASGLAGDAPVRAVERVEALLAEAERFSLNEDGTVAATKPTGVAYTEFARVAVEWFLDRELARSGAQYPRHAEKTPDDLAWARYLKDASELALRDGVDFAGLLAAADERRVRLPNPGEYFAE